MAKEGQSTAHVLCIPCAGYGHIVPMLKLCKEIASKGITFTFAVYEDDVARIRREDLKGELQSLGFRFIPLQQAYVVRSVGNPQVISEEVEKAFRPVFSQLLSDKNSGISGPTSILSDMFFPWTQDAADELQIPRYMFVPSGCILARNFQCCAEYFALGKLKISQTEDKLEMFEGTISMPGLPTLSYFDLPTTIRFQAAYYEERCRSAWRVAGVVVNSFAEFEPKVLEAWRKPEHPGFEKIKVPKIYPIGPIKVLSANVLNGTVVRNPEDPGSRSLDWLDSQPPSSVLYVAFGSWISLSPENIEELALGLESSNQRFLWVLPERKEGFSVTESLPSGFQERVADRGFICVGWAPQVQILAHSSTGGFLTHAGWNSSLESVAMGVPMITCPQGAEQHLNSRYLVDEAKIAFEIRQGTEMILKQKEVARVVRLLMLESEEAKEVRSRAASFKIKAAKAVSSDGSTSKAVEEFAADLLSH